MSEVLQEVESVCPECLQKIDARLVQKGDTVWIEKVCPDHGPFSTVIWQGMPAFSSWSRPKIPYKGGVRKVGGEGCPADCGLCVNHGQRTCTALVEITSRCNLNCPVCFADSGGNESGPDPATLSRMFAQIIEQTGGCNLQLSGGEPTVRNDLPRIVRLASEAGFGFIQLNTNGLLLAENPELAVVLKEAGLSSVFLQFDGIDDAVYTALRGRPLWALKQQAIKNISEAGIGIVLVPTVSKGVNDDQLWEIVRFGLQHQPHVRGVHFQPMSYFGRYPENFIPDHVTLPEIMSGLFTQSGGKLNLQDFKPPGCEHTLCSFSAKYLIQENGELLRMGSDTCDCSPSSAESGALKSIGVTSRQWSFPVELKQTENASNEEPVDDFDRFLRRARTHIFSVSSMAFQDCWNLNLERLQGCCIHVAQPDGRLIPFCSFNLTSRSGISLHRGKVSA